MRDSKTSQKTCRSKYIVERQERHGLPTGWNPPQINGWEKVKTVEIPEGDGWWERAIEKAVGHKEPLDACPYWYKVIKL